MAAVTVFVDEAVRGDFPPVCARTGRPTSDMAWFEQTVGQQRSGLLILLLLFLGPVGWLIALVLVLTERRETLTVRLPYSQEAWAEDRRYTRLIAVAAVAGIAALVLSFGFVGTGQGALWLIIGVGLLVGSLAGAWIRKWEDPGFSLDASRRWVRLTRVHPAFVDATLARPAALTSSR